MTVSRAVPSVIRALNTLDGVSAATVLGVCASIKPAPGRQGRSATRSLLSFALSTLGAVYANVALLDLRDHPPPFFDGRMPHDYDHPDLQFVWSCVDRAGALLLSAPAYWSGVSGVFKNFVDVLCGPVYDMDGVIETVFAKKPVGILVVGADDASARAGAEQAKQIVNSTGACLVADPVVMANPRANGEEVSLISRELIAVGAELARLAYDGRVRDAAVCR